MFFFGSPLKVHEPALSVASEHSDEKNLSKVIRTMPLLRLTDEAQDDNVIDPHAHALQALDFEPQIPVLTAENPNKVSMQLCIPGKYSKLVQSIS